MVTRHFLSNITNLIADTDGSPRGKPTTATFLSQYSFCVQPEHPLFPHNACSPQPSPQKLLFTADGDHGRNPDGAKCREQLSMGSPTPTDKPTPLLLHLRLTPCSIMGRGREDCNNQRARMFAVR